MFFLEDALDILLPRAYEKALTETEIRPVEQPVVDVEEIERGVGGVTLIFEVDVYPPRLELGKYKSLQAERTAVRIDEEDVLKVLEQQQERSAQLVVAERTTVQKGDFATLDFIGSIDGQPFSGGAAEDHTLEIGSGQFIPGFEEQLIGLELNVQSEIEVTFPEDYHAENLAGKQAVFEVTVKELKEKHLPELDDEFAKDMGDYETLDELKADIRKNLEDEATRRTTDELENRLLELIAADSEVEVPASMVAHQAEHLLEYFFENLRRQGGLDEEKYLEITGQSREELLEQFEPQAQTQIIHDLILESVFAQEGITVGEEEVNSKIEEYMGSSSDMEEELAERLREYWNEQRANIESALQREKALQFIIDNAEITEVERVEEPAEIPAEIPAEE